MLKQDTEKWLNAIESGNTQRGYAKHINDFCEFVFGSTLEELDDNVFDKQSVDFNTMLKYKNYLVEEKKAGQTIRTKIYAIKSWLEYLYKTNKYNVPAPAKLKLDKKIMPKQKNNNGSKPFTHSEMIDMIKKAKEYKNGDMKSLLLECAYITAWRKEALIASQKKDLYKLKDNVDHILWDIVDKGEKEDTKAITLELYDRLMALNPTGEDEDLIFPLSNTSVDNLINQLKKDLNIPGDKSFHGIKKASIMRVLDLTDDLLRASEHGCHESVDTTAKFYAMYNKDYSLAMSLHIMDELRDDYFDDYSKDELLSLIRNSENKVKFALMLQSQKKNKL